MIAIKLQEAQWTTTSPIPSSFKKNCINSFASLSMCINSLLSCSLLLICFINYWGGQLSREVISTHKHLSTFCLLEFFSPSEWNLLEINTGTVVTFTTPDISITQHYVIYMMNLQPSWYKIHRVTANSFFGYKVLDWAHNYKMYWLKKLNQSEVFFKSLQLLNDGFSVF